MSVGVPLRAWTSGSPKANRRCASRHLLVRAGLPRRIRTRSVIAEGCFRQDLTRFTAVRRRRRFRPARFEDLYDAHFDQLPWRRDRDLNPRYPFGVHALSKRAHSTTLASLRMGSRQPRAGARRPSRHPRGGGVGIRTLGDLSVTPVFETGTFDHSVTPPQGLLRHVNPTQLLPRDSLLVAARAPRQDDFRCRAGPSAGGGSSRAGPPTAGRQLVHRSSAVGTPPQWALRTARCQSMRLPTRLHRAHRCPARTDRGFSRLRACPQRTPRAGTRTRQRVRPAPRRPGD